jgi:hypothetical protein
MATKRKATNTKSRSKSVKTQQRSAKTKSNDLPALESWADMFVRDVRDYELTELAHSDERYYIEAGFGIDSLKLKTIREILSDLKTYGNQARDVFAELKDFIAKFSDLDPQKIIDIVTQLQQPKTNDPEAETLILTYLLKGECKDRLGTVIKKPEGALQTEYFNIGLDLSKILLQRFLDKKYGLLWLPDSNSSLDDQKKAHRFWETYVTKLSDPLIGSGVSAGLSAIPSLQDDAKKGASMVIGVSSSKTVEALVAKAIDYNPQMWIDRMKAIEGKG